MKTKITRFFKKNRKTMIFLGILAIAAALIIPNLAFAATAAATPTPEQSILNSIQTLGRQISELLNRILWPVLILIGGLLKTDILYSSGMEERLLALWGQMRDLVNILFVIILLAIAFYNVMGGNDQEFQVKTVLPKFVIALILVNFSYVGIKVVLDGVNVLTTAIFALPTSVSQDKGVLPTSADFEKNICEGFYGRGLAYNLNTTGSGATVGSALCNEKKEFKGDMLALFNHYDANNAAMVIAVNIAKISNLDNVFPKKNMELKDLNLNILFSAVFYIIYATAFVCLFIVLVARLCVLWLCIVLSPFAALMYVLPKSITSKVGEGKLDVKEKFVQHAFVPIPVALVMTIGFVMLQQFSVVSFKTPTLSASTLNSGVLLSGTSTLQDIIVGVAMVVFIWMGIFAAMGKTAASGITDGIKGMVEGAGKFVGTSWKYIPAFPVAGGKPVSLAGMEQLPGVAERKLQGRASDEASRMGKDLLHLEGNDHAENIRNSKNYQELRGNLRGVYDEGAGGDNQVQRELSAQIKKDHGKFDEQFKNNFDHLSPTQRGNMNWTDFKKKMEDGTLGKDSMQAFLEDVTRGVTPPSQKPVLEPGKPKGKGAAKPAQAAEKEVKPPANEAVTAELADSIIKDTSAYAKEGDKKAIKEYNESSAADKIKKRQEPAFQGILEKLQKQANQGQDFRQELRGATDKSAVAALVQKRKAALSDGTPEGAQKAAGIIKSEIEGDADTNSNVQKYLEGGKIEGITISKPAAVKPAAPKAPAGKTKKATENTPPAASTPAITGASQGNPIPITEGDAANMGLTGRGLQQKDGKWYRVE